MQKLEEYRIFKYVAWVTVIIFAFYTGYLAGELDEAAQDSLVAVKILV